MVSYFDDVMPNSSFSSRLQYPSLDRSNCRSDCQQVHIDEFVVRFYYNV